MSLPNLLSLIEDLVYRESVREAFDTYTDQQAQQTYGLTATEVSIVRDKSISDFRSSLTFTSSAFERCYPSTIAAMRYLNLNLTDMVETVFDQDDDYRNRALYIAEYLWSHALANKAPDWLFHVIAWETALISPPGPRDFEQLQLKPLAARLVQTTWNIKEWCGEDGGPHAPPLMAPQPHYYIIVPDQFARHASHAKVYELSDCLYLAFESYIGEDCHDDGTDVVRTQFEQFCINEQLFVVESVHLDKCMFWV